MKKRFDENIDTDIEFIKYIGNTISELKEEIARVLNIVNVNQAGKFEDISNVQKDILHIRNAIATLEDEVDMIEKKDELKDIYKTLRHKKLKRKICQRKKR